MLLAVVPAIVPVLAALGVVGAGALVWWYSVGRDNKLEPGEQPGVLPPGTGDEPGPGAPKELVESLTGLYTDGKFHQTQSGDSIAKVAYQTVKKISPTAANSPQVVGAVRRLLNQSAMNRELFGESMPDDNYTFDGVAVNRFAMPKHEDTVAVMELGFLPVRNIDANGKKVGPSSKNGDLWIPALNHEAIQGGVADETLLLAGTWEDGTPATEPPPELFAVLEERA